MTVLIILLIIYFIFGSNSNDKKITELENRISDLEYENDPSYRNRNIYLDF